MNQTNIKIGQLRDRMKELGIDAYLVPTADFHESEYVGEFFKCRHFLTGFNGTAGTAVITMDKASGFVNGIFRSFISDGCPCRLPSETAYYYLMVNYA